MGTFTQNLLLQEPTPGDPAVKNAWGVILNGNFALIDSAVAGILALSVAGNSNVILTSTSGEPDQARNADFVFAGVLTGNITVFWPTSLSGMFSVLNATTGAFSLTLAVNNGSGAPDGAVVVVPQGSSMNLKSNGTDILERGTYSTFDNTPAAAATTTRNNIGAAGQAGAENFALDTGTANHLVAALSPAVTALTSGLTVVLTALNANTGTTDFNLNALGAKTVYKPGVLGPVVLNSGDVQPANDILLTYDAALNSAAGGWFVLGGLPVPAPLDQRIVGETIDWPTNTAPAKFLICDGSVVSRTTYAALFGVIGTVFGVGNGTTTFNIPDYRGRSGVGGNNSSLPNGVNATYSVRAVAATGGEEAHALTGTENGPHVHTLPAANSHIAAGGPDVEAFTGGSISTDSSGTGAAHNTMHPFLVANKAIYAGV